MPLALSRPFPAAVTALSRASMPALDKWNHSLSCLWKICHAIQNKNISRTTSMRYKKTDKTLPQIARELNVDAIIEGTVLRSGERVRISVQLINAHTDTHLWAQSYDRDLRDILALHAELAQAVAREVQVKLTPHDYAHFAHAHPVDPEAYEAYLKGRYY